MRGAVYNTVRFSLSRHCFTSTRHFSSQDVAYCVEIVKKNDRPNYQIGLLCPKDLMAPFFVFRALYIELAAVKDAVRDVQLGSMRMHWWGEGINAALNGDRKLPDQPVIRALAEVAKSKTFRPRWIERMFEARLADVQGNRLRTQQEMVDFCEMLNTSPLIALAEMSGLKDAETNQTLAYIGRSVGMATLLRGIPFHVRNREIYLPVYEMAQKGVSQEEFFRLDKVEKISEVVYDCANFAWGNLEEARSRMHTIPKKLRPICLSTIIAEEYLKRLEKVNFNVFDQDLLQPRPLSLQLRLLKHYLLRTY